MEIKKLIQMEKDAVDDNGLSLTTAMALLDLNFKYAFVDTNLEEIKDRKDTELRLPQKLMILHMLKNREPAQARDTTIDTIPWCLGSILCMTMERADWARRVIHILSKAVGTSAIWE